MPQPYVGEIRVFAGNFAPTGWAFCNGQLLPISQNIALFSLLGTTYGGNGTSNFALPNLQGRTPIGSGDGPGLTPRSAGNSLGEEAHTVLGTEMPGHTHSMGASAANGTSDAPANGVMARSPAAIPLFHVAADTQLHSSVVVPAGASQPHNNMQPYLTLNFIIALQGMFPQRWP